MANLRRLHISTSMDIDGTPWRVTITRPFALSALMRRGLSDSEFFQFVDEQEGTIALLAKRKVRRHQLQGGRVTLDESDLP
jgi:hypothetical protein